MLYGLLHTGFVQSFLLNKVTGYLSNELQVEVSAGAVHFKPFRSILLENVSMHDRENRNLFVVEHIKVQLESFSRRNKKIVFSEIGFHEALFNIHKDEKHHNFQFLIDYFSKTDTADALDVTSPWEFKLKSVQIANTILNYLPTENNPNNTGFFAKPFALHDINVALSNIIMTNDSLLFELDYLRYHDYNNPAINHLSGSFGFNDKSALINNFLLCAGNSELQFDLVAAYEGVSRSAFSLEDVSFELSFEPSVISMADIAHFYYPMHGADESIFISGRLTGQGRSVKGQKIKLSDGNGTMFHGDFLLSDVSDLQKSHFDIEVQRVSSSFADIKNLKLPYAWNIDSLAVPESLFGLGKISYTGTLAGNLNDFRSEGSFNTEIGTLKSNVLLLKNETSGQYRYNGLIEARRFDLGKLLDNTELIGKIDMQAELNGEGFDLDNINLFFDGKIASVDIQNYQYHNIELKGGFSDRKFNGSFLVIDENLFFDFGGMVDFSEDAPVFDFEASIKEANLSALNIFQRDSLTNSFFNANLVIKASGFSIDDMEGVITINDLLYKETSFENDTSIADTLIFATDSMHISNTLWSENQKHFRIRSELVDADIYGKIQFDQIRSSLDNFIYTYIPTLHNGTDIPLKPVGDVHDLEYSIRIKELDALSYVFFPDVSISPGSWINGSYSSLNQDFELEAHAGMFELAGRMLIDWNIIGNNTDKQFVFNTNSQKLMLSDSLHLNNFDLRTIIDPDGICLEVKWDNGSNDLKNEGYFVGIGKIPDASRFEFKFLSSYAYIEGDLWQLNVDHKIFIENKRIELHQLMAFNNEQFIRADGVLSADSYDQMTLSFANFDVSYSEYFMNTKSFEFGGILNGYISFTGLYQQPGILTELFIKDFSFNHDHLGDLAVESLWDSQKQAFKVDATITYHGNIGSNQPLVVSGYIDPNSENQNFDLDITITNKKMSVWGRYMEAFASNFRGLASGRLRLDGAFSNPELTGNVRLLRTALHIPYLNTTYSFAHDVEIGKDYFLFDNMVLNDTIGNTAILSGRLMHDRFKDFSIDFRLRPERMVIFNTTAAQQEYYHGTAFLTGLAHIHGPVTNITMDVSARTNRGTTVILPLDYTGEIRESHFISFVTHDTGEDVAGFILPEIQGGMTLNFDLEVTPDAEVQLLFDARFGDIIRGRGTGNLRLEITPEGLFNIYGDYVIESGEYIFMLQNIINKRFRIEQGGTIRWTGDLNDADVQLSGVYQVRTQLYDLIAGEFTDPALAEIYRRRLPIETVLMLDDKLFNPAISFDIRVPGGDESTRELIERVITTEQEMNRQVFSLLVLNRFIPATFDQYNTALGYGVGSTSSELLSNQLSNWLSQISSDFDIGINYRPGDELSSQELELALSTQLFDDRVLIDGNFGVAGNETAAGQSTQGASQIIGDVNIEVKLTPEGKLRVKAFNRSNTFDILNTNAPYTQGIGIFYRREFDDFVDLFKRQRQPGEIMDEAAGSTGSDPTGANLRPNGGGN